MAIAMSQCRNLCNVTVKQLFSLLLFVPMHVSETYYLVQWLDEDKDGDVLYDVLPSKSIESDVLKLDVGSVCSARYHESYSAKILQRGKHIVIERIIF